MRPWLVCCSWNVGLASDPRDPVSGPCPRLQPAPGAGLQVHPAGQVGGQQPRSALVTSSYSSGRGICTPGSGRPCVAVLLPEPAGHYKPTTGELSITGSQAPRGRPAMSLPCRGSPSGGAVGAESAPELLQPASALRGWGWSTTHPGTGGRTIPSHVGGSQPRGWPWQGAS